MLQTQSSAHQVTEMPTRFIIFATELMSGPKQARINVLKSWSASGFTRIVRKRQKVKGQFTGLNQRQIPAYNVVLSFNSLLRNVVTFITPLESVTQFGFSIATKEQKIQSENQGFCKHGLILFI